MVSNSGVELTEEPSGSGNRRIRVFISSTFLDMIEERDELMTRAWPELRRFCRERHVELIEVDLRWGISEEQCNRKETLKLCLDEIRACRPFFVGLLGERYGWVPDDQAYTSDLREEQPWLGRLKDRSVTELEILHGVLNDPDMAGRAFFYFRDPKYARNKGTNYLSESEEAEKRQRSLKERISKVSEDRGIPLRLNYPDPQALAKQVEADLKAAIAEQFPFAQIPNSLQRQAREHEAFAETRRRTYIGKNAYYKSLNRHCRETGGPLVVLGDSGGGKSSLLANWVSRWRSDHREDFVFQHYIGGTPDSASPFRLMARLIGEIRNWIGDDTAQPKSNDDILRTFPEWLTKARLFAERRDARCIVVLDSLTQLEPDNQLHHLSWLPSNPMHGRLRLIVSTLPGVTHEALKSLRWQSFKITPLKNSECREMIRAYLNRFSKKLDTAQLDRLAAATPTANPLYLKILLDELRVTGTHEHLDERLDDYLSAPDIPTLLGKVLKRYRRDYERDRPGLVGDALGLIWCSRRGLSESELLRALRPSESPQLPVAFWAPLRAALEEGVVDRGGILNFAHEFLRKAVASEFVDQAEKASELRLRLANDFARQDATVEGAFARSCDELPWLLKRAGERDRLHACLCDIDRFIEIQKRDQEELSRYWIWLGKEREMGQRYRVAFETWQRQGTHSGEHQAHVAGHLAFFLSQAGLYFDAEPVMLRAIELTGETFGRDHPKFAEALNNLALLLQDSGRPDEAESKVRQALDILLNRLEPDDPNIASNLSNLATLLLQRGALEEAETMIRRALLIDEKILGPEYLNTGRDLNTLAQILQDQNRYPEARELMERSLQIARTQHGLSHPSISVRLANLAHLLRETGDPDGAERMLREAADITETSYGSNHPELAIRLRQLADVLWETNQFAEGEKLYLRAVSIDEANLGLNHPQLATNLSYLARIYQSRGKWHEAAANFRRALEIETSQAGADESQIALRMNDLAFLLEDLGRLDEAEDLFREAVEADEKAFGPHNPIVASDLHNLARIVRILDRFDESETLMRRAIEIDGQNFGVDSLEVASGLNNLAHLQHAAGNISGAEVSMGKALKIFLRCDSREDLSHAMENYRTILFDSGLDEPEVERRIRELLDLDGS